MSTILRLILDGAALPFQGRFETNGTDAGLSPHSVPEVAGAPVSAANPMPTAPGGSGPGTANNANAPALLANELASGTVTNPGQLWVQNQSGDTLQLVLGTAGNQSIYLLGPGAGTGSQGADFSAQQYASTFVGPYAVYGPNSTDQVGIWHN